MKGYIGQTTKSVKSRVGCHCASKGCRYLSSAIKKYGINNFSIGVLGCYPIAEIDAMERKFIADRNTLVPNGYNLQTGGMVKHTCSEETRLRLSNANKGRKQSKEHIQRRMCAHIGCHRSPETCHNIGKASKGRVLSEETRLKISAKSKARGYEIGLTTSKTFKGKPKSQEQRKKMSDAAKGIPKSEEHRKNISIAKTAWYAKKKLEATQCH
jgi:group I intron endonuclease